MAVDFLQKSAGNSASTTLSSAVSNTDTSFPLTSDTNFLAGGGFVIVDEGESTEELAYYTGKSGSSLTVPLANRGLEGGSAQAHSSGATVKGVLSADMWNNVTEALVNVVSVTTGALDTTKVVDLTTAQTLTNKTLTSPVLTTPQVNDTSADHQYVTAVSELTADRTVTLPLLTADDTYVFRNHDNVAIKFNAPQGFLVNGKIVPSVTSNNLTVAIKGMDGNDPSATNPVYCRIGDTVRSITSALSLTTNAGANTFNMGSAELATKEVDIFVYLGYSAVDASVVLAICRIPYANRFDDFNGTGTNEKGYKSSTYGTPTASDAFENIGRFAATLSAGAGYTWTVPTFTTANLIQRPIYETRWLAYVPQFTVAEIDNGSGGQPTVTDARYRIVGRNGNAHLKGAGVKAGTNSYFSCTPPMLWANYASGAVVGHGRITSATTTDNSSFITAGTAVCYFNQSANIADNAAVDLYSASLNYET